MIKRVFFLIFISFICICGFAQQDDAKYLQGAVTEKEGKVFFSKTIPMNGLTKDEIFTVVADWANVRFAETGDYRRKVLSRDSIGGELLAVGDEYIVFEDKFFSLDRSRILYYFIAKCSDGRCQLSFFKINYLYQISSDQLSERYSAEEMISDAVGLKRGKLVKKNSKFRIKTIDLVDAAFAEVTGLLGQKLLAKLNQSK